jgi:hypothetical protein
MKNFMTSTILGSALAALIWSGIALGATPWDGDKVVKLAQDLQVHVERTLNQAEYELGWNGDYRSRQAIWDLRFYNTASRFFVQNVMKNKTDSTATAKDFELLVRRHRNAESSVTRAFFSWRLMFELNETTQSLRDLAAYY